MTSRRRVAAVDIARGVALLGMLISHVDPVREFVISDPTTWLHIAEGRAANLFVVVAGVSLALSTGGPSLDARTPLAAARSRVLVKAVILFGLGGVLTWLHTPVAVILEFYAAYFVLTLPFLRWRPRGLIVLAAVLAVVGSIAIVFVSSVAPAVTVNGLGYLLFGGSYPVATWLSFMLFGLAIGRMNIESTRTAVLFIGVGLVLTIVGFALMRLFRTGISPSATVSESGAFFDVLSAAAASALASGVRSTSPFVMLSVAGSALVVLGLAVFAHRYARVVFIPLASVGRMSLTLYCAHIVAIAFVMNSAAYREGALLLPCVVAALVIATVWFLRFKQGPLEAGLRTIAYRTASDRSAA